MAAGFLEQISARASERAEIWFPFGGALYGIPSFVLITDPVGKV